MAAKNKTKSAADKAKAEAKEQKKIAAAEERQRKADEKKKLEDAKKKEEEAANKKEGDTTDIYLVTLTVADKVYESSGETLPEAILGLKPDQMKAKGILVVKFNEKSTERMMYAKQLKRPLVNKDAAIFLAKNLIMTLK
jgi:chromatin remodeling complex protein RSC6